MLLLLLPVVAAPALVCNKHKVAATCYKGQLVVKAACMNYTISVLDGTMDTSKIEKIWTDETTGKVYQNAFRLGSPCNFPNTIKEGDIFYFELAENAVQNCAVCMMYYPTPQKKLAINVVPGPCR